MPPSPPTGDERDGERERAHHDEAERLHPQLARVPGVEEAAAANAEAEEPPSECEIQCETTE
jgi:hypothetical protein